MEEQKTKLQMLKEEATALGIAYSPNIGVKTLETRVKTYKAQGSVPGGIQATTPVVAPAVAAVAAPVQPSPEQIRARKIKDATRLVRVLITCMNPEKTKVGERQGEYVMAGNSVVPTIKRFVPYGHPTHVERILLNKLEESRYQQRYGKNMLHVREVKEFQIQELEPLTVQEAEELKKVQELRKEANQHNL